VLGLAGLVGAGRSELARLIFGADRGTGGEVWLEGKPLTLRSPLDAIHNGIAYLTEDRKAQGLFLDMSVRESITISVLGRDALAGGLLNRVAMARLTAGSIQDLRVRVAGPFVAVGALSGGNQQKLLIARWIAIHPKVLILDEPTKGVESAPRPKFTESSANWPPRASRFWLSPANCRRSSASATAFW
jgi:ribose transport system ATP-binding protein